MALLEDTGNDEQMLVSETDAFRLHKFIQTNQKKNKSPLKQATREFVISPSKQAKNDVFTPIKERNGQPAPVFEERFSVNVHGIIEYMKFFQQCQRDPTKRQSIFDIEKVKAKL